ncbi:hypothetical protein GW756_04210 [bacterium]|nr:hypothetical protein [bacterium]NCQ55195.1 hypothetical protein [Candidatus Parcubacteria bacterium]NCS67292.1 hypothetical protein [Candidatus Peregrinibacteria bacterium]NCS96547.1 hypothetical protein [bacterium]
MPLDNLSDSEVGFGGGPDYGPNILAVNSIPYPITAFQSSGSDYQCLTLVGDDGEFVGETYYITPPVQKANLLINASSINYRGQALRVIQK